ncbi:alpha/beta fold hydrolase [Enterobacteriaceae endosymbiont of Plateumaris consimilis]|uniref:alpha/beta fold hydrolase n=1 Tax=Enterobacteriaceae endosymbiont of Plateumaris consimilis TaxID=2675794 RepID=UPI001449D879|nr:alpha/beta fold hydrolase [Enterobacteriaceae endosymbiont of Plateumaris consimilis]QJC28709.1 alpha/beta fold hydrolase [Enterobacteriaceae endosymbiont of Plateumaris consimilis]
MILNYSIIPINNFDQKINRTIITIHGLFGNKHSLHYIAKILNKKLKYKIVEIDVRNHGSSPHNNNMDYILMAQDILDTLKYIGIKNKIIIIGHSMGGKIAMTMTKLIPNFIKKIIILDIAPVNYYFNNKNIFFILNKIHKLKIFTKVKAFEIMSFYIKKTHIIKFLLNSFSNGKWKFNLPILSNEYNTILNWKIIPSWLGEILFLKGEKSLYVNHIYYKKLFDQFPLAKIYNISAGHFLHIEKTNIVINKIFNFCLK